MFPNTTLEHLHCNALTRLEFIQCINQLINDEVPLLLLYLDIDNFKSINSSLGHHIGDKVLAEASARLIEFLPHHASLGHFGGDEFGILIPTPSNTCSADVWARRIISLMSTPFDLHHFSKGLSCSIGSVTYPKDGNNAQLLVQNADIAMYEAKERGRRRSVKFNQSMKIKAWIGLLINYILI